MPSGSPSFSPIQQHLLGSIPGPGVVVERLNIRSGGIQLVSKTRHFLPSSRWSRWGQEIRSPVIIKHSKRPKGEDIMQGGI